MNSPQESQEGKLLDQYAIPLLASRPEVSHGSNIAGCLTVCLKQSPGSVPPLRAQVLRRHEAGEDKRRCKSKPLKPEPHLFHRGLCTCQIFSLSQGSTARSKGAGMELLFPLQAHLGLSTYRPATGSVGLIAALEAQLFIASIRLSDE